MTSHYNTTGQLDGPLVTLHTTHDPIVPYWHEFFYEIKLFLTGSRLMRVNVPVYRFGHCQFTAAELVLGFALLIEEVTGQDLEGFEAVLSQLE